MEVKFQAPGSGVDNSTNIFQRLGLAKKVDPPEPPPVAIKIDKGLILDAAPTGRELNRRGEAQENLVSQEALIDPTTFQEYTDFTTEYVRKLLDLKANTDLPPGTPAGIRDRFEYIASNGKHEHDIRLLNELSTNGQPDPEKIRKMLTTAEGLMLTTSLMDYDRSEKLAALALMAASDPGGDRMGIAGNMNVSLVEGRGAIANLITGLRHGEQSAINKVVALYATGIGANLGAYAGLAAGVVNPAFPLVGAALGPLAAAGAGAVLRSLEPGGQINLTRCTEAFEQLEADPREAFWMKNRTGVDINDFVVAAPGRLERRPGPNYGTTNLEGTVQDILRSTHARNDFLGKFVDRRLIDATGNQFLFGGIRNAGTPEQVNTKLQRRILDRFQAAGGFALNAAGEIDYPTTLERYGEIERKTMCDMIEEMVQKQARGTRDMKIDDAVSRLSEKATEFSDTGEAQERAKQGLREEKALLKQMADGENGNNGLRIDESGLENYQQELKKLTEARDRLKKAGFTGVAEVDKELAERQRLPLARLQELQQKLTAAEAAAIAAESNGNNLDTQFASAASFIDGIAANPNIPIDENDFRVLPVARIMERANEAYKWGQTQVPPIAVGWPPQDNEIQREIVYKAKGEARARAMDARVGARSASNQEAINRGLTEHAIRTLPLDMLVDRLNAAGVMPGRAALLDLANPADRQFVREIVAESQVRLSMRSQAMRDVFSREARERTLHNSQVAVERAHLEDEIKTNRQEQSAMEQEENVLEQLRKPSTIATEFTEKHTQEFVNSYATFEAWSASLVAEGYNDLKPEDLHTLPIDEIHRRLQHVMAEQAAGRLTTMLNPPADQDQLMRFLSVARSESLARSRNGPIMTTESPGLQTLLGLRISESELRTLADSQIYLLIAQRGGGSFGSTVAERQQLQQAILQSKNRYNLREESLSTVITESRALVPPYNTTDVSFLRINADYRARETNLASRRARLGVTSSAELQARINEQQRQVRMRFDYQDLSAELKGTADVIDSYLGSLQALQVARLELQQSNIPGGGTVKDIEAIIQARGTLTEDQLKTLRDEVTNLEIQLTEATDGPAVQAQEIVDSMHTNYDQIIGIGPALAAAGLPPINITPDMLRTSPPGELMRLINQAHEAGRGLAPPLRLGWPAIDNDLPEVRHRLSVAMAEAQAEEINPAIINPSAALVNMRNGGISESVMRTYQATDADAERLIRSYNERNAVPIVIDPATIALYRGVITESQQRLEVRQQALKDTTDRFSRRTRELDRAIGEPVDAVRRQFERVTAARDLAARRLTLYSNLDQIQRRAGEFTSTQRVSNAAGRDLDYTPAERATGQLKGYYEFLQFLFDYQNAPNREEAFQMYSRVLPPLELATHLATELDITVTGIRRDQRLGHVLGILEGSLMTGRVTQHELQRSMRNMIFNISSQGLAIAA